jgi:hypothetical protein
VSADRYRLLGLARPRATWFRDLSRWATSAALPVEFVKCVATDELLARLQSGRIFSAVVLDSGLSTLDRDLIDVAREAGAAVIVIDDGHTRRDWPALGVDAVLPDTLDRGLLLTTLVACAPPLSGPDLEGGTVAPPPAMGWRGRLIAVTGPAGGGRSTVAMALAQGLSAPTGQAGMVVLADLALHADQALLHDAGDVMPGVQELTEAHRRGEPTVDDILDLTFTLDDRGYHLLLGLRRHRDWTVLRGRSVEAAIDGLLRAYPLVVADIDADVEGDDEVGSVDVEDRNRLARSTARRADLVVVSAPPTLVGLRRLVVTIDDLRRLGVDPARVLAVINRAPRRGRHRAEITVAVAELGRSAHAELGALPSPVFITERRGLDDLIRTGNPLPRPLVTPVTAAVLALLERQPLISAAIDAFEPVAITPGSLGSWAEHEAAE